MLFIRCGTFGLMLSGRCRPWWDTAGRSAAFIWRANDWSAAQPINPSRSVNAEVLPNPSQSSPPSLPQLLSNFTLLKFLTSLATSSSMSFSTSSIFSLTQHAHLIILIRFGCSGIFSNCQIINLFPF